MPKRKREGLETGNDGSSILERQQKTVAQQIELGKKGIVKNLKLAKGFERQKLGRKQQDAVVKKDTATNARVQTEIDALKKLNLQTAAEYHLYKTLLKVKSIVSTGTLPSGLETLPKTPLDTATANITARLYNAKLVKDSLDATIRGIRKTLHLEDVGKAGLKKKKSKMGETENGEQRPTKKLKADSEQSRSEPGQQKKEQPKSQNTESLLEKSTRKRSPSIASLSEQEEEFRGFSDGWTERSSGQESDSEGDDEEVPQSDASEYDSDAFAAFDARMASSDDDDSDFDDMRATAAAQLKRELAEAASKPDTPSVTADIVFEESGITAATETAEEKVEENKQAPERSNIPSTSATTTIEEPSSVFMQLTTRPVTSLDVAKRMIHAHLGIKHPRTLKKSSDEDVSASDISEKAPHSPISQLSPANRTPGSYEANQLYSGDLDLPMNGTVKAKEAHSIQIGASRGKINEQLASDEKSQAHNDRAKVVDIDISKALEDLENTAQPILTKATKEKKRKTEVQGSAGIDIGSKALNNTNNAKVPTKKRKLEQEPSSDSESEISPRKSANKEKASPQLKPTTSAFLPSLTNGGYWSGSESEASDIEELVAPRKNRRGQRARQAIAEAKFGVAAKHLKDGPVKKTKDARDQGWDIKRGATGSEDVRGFKGMNRKERRGRMDGAHKAGASGGNAIPIGPSKSTISTGGAKFFEKPAVVKPKRDDTGPLHPSWEAKRKAKENGEKIVPFQGKKITFD